MSGWLALLGLALLVGIIVLQARTAGRRYRPLASRQPERRVQERPLGLEAIDLEELSRATRRNESLERGQTNWLGRAGFFGRTDADVRPLADDETYAARFHSAFQKDRKKDEKT